MFGITIKNISKVIGFPATITKFAMSRSDIIKYTLVGLSLLNVGIQGTYRFINYVDDVLSSDSEVNIEKSKDFYIGFDKKERGNLLSDVRVNPKYWKENNSLEKLLEKWNKKERELFKDCFNSLKRNGVLEKLENSYLRYGISPYFGVTLVSLESDCGVNLESDAGALGLAQIMPETAVTWCSDIYEIEDRIKEAELEGVFQRYRENENLKNKRTKSVKLSSDLKKKRDNLYDEIKGVLKDDFEKNIECSARYVAYLAKKHTNYNPEKIFLSYNGGPHMLSKPRKESKKYKNGGKLLLEFFYKNVDK